MQVGQEQGWGYLVPRDRLERRYDSVKAPEPQGKGQIARGRGKKKGSARVWRPVLEIWANGVTFSPALRKTHLGLDPMYKTQKQFARKNQIARKEGNMKGSARVWRNSALGFGPMESLSAQR